MSRGSGVSREAIGSVSGGEAATKTDERSTYACMGVHGPGGGLDRLGKVSHGK